MNSPILNIHKIMLNYPSISYSITVDKGHKEIRINCSETNDCMIKKINTITPDGWVIIL